ncbi:acyl-CoA dehydrogenase family protein [Jiella sonneratiae]|uniref:Acyl-CoA dehydrogenase n=1 Tax=Jiella sonneratiae TaxID=2816856 RepID=A0ABS3JBE5_9HYPH|nr:acyl-CoA dehydrogenase family protein [Jiella sonneratiae]MBO0906472.1 acyl-CoA dehydrogenase [Jiella sonneratiae]
MRRDPPSPSPSPTAKKAEGGLAHLSREIARLAADEPEREAFPSRAFDALRRLGLTARPPIGAGSGGELLRLLAAVGRGDLGVGRIFEGHVNALDLVARFGSGAIREAVAEEAGRGALFGVWNTDDVDAPLRVSGDRLAGRKSFASGVDGLSFAIVTAPVTTGRQMFLVRLAGVAVDRSWWKPLGMKSSGSHVVDFAGVPAEHIEALGRPDDYLKEPWFTGGAVRFAAVQAGGVEAVFDAALAHLRRTGRAGNPHQAHRIGRMGLAVETVRLWRNAAGSALDEALAAGGEGVAAEKLVATANGFRSLVEDCAMRVLDEAERAVGAAGFNAPHPLERLVADLRTYLRQPNPDGALAGFAEWLVAGDRDAPGEAN